jgi:multidrug efflux system membrane fusion protein
LIDSGLAEGEQVVVDGQYKLQEGSTVKIAQPGSKSAPTAAPSSADGGNELH